MPFPTVSLAFPWLCGAGHDVFCKTHCFASVLCQTVFCVFQVGRALQEHRDHGVVLWPGASWQSPAGEKDQIPVFKWEAKRK